MCDLSDAIITPDQAKTLPGLFSERVQQTPDASAYLFFDSLNGVWASITWHDMAKQMKSWQMALASLELQAGDRVAIMARNSRLWVLFDQAALSMGLVVVPIYTEDRADNVHYVMEHSGAKLLIVGGQQQWDRLEGKLRDVKSLKHIVSIAEIESPNDKRLQFLDNWLSVKDVTFHLPELQADDLATLVYTSGTTGNPKGVMLSHRNILSNAYSGLQAVYVDEEFIFLSFLPLSHALERTVGYYLPMMAGGTVAHARSIAELAKDMLAVKPQGLISVPRIYERVYAKIKENLATQPAYVSYLFKMAVNVGWHRFEKSQGRAAWHPKLLLWPMLKRMVADKIVSRFGGNLKVCISGGAALSPEVAKVFISLGIPIYQGYGLTETSPVVSVNTLEKNVPASIGPPLPGVEVKIGEDDELLVKGESVMLGYWGDDIATQQVIDGDGWLHTGDKARINDGHIFLTGRLKDIIVLANGEKVSPVDAELAIISDELFEQIVLVGESRPFLSALVVLNQASWQKISGGENTSESKEKILLERIAKCLHDFPGYVELYGVYCVDEPWTVENDLLTSTMKPKRSKIMEKYAEEIEKMYEGH